MTGGGDQGAARVLASFPKTRPAMPPRLQAIYVQQYKENRAGATPAASLSQRLERWLHLQVARDAVGGAPRATLELGAGTLNQPPFEPAAAPYDIVEPFADLYRDAPERGRVRDVFADVTEVPRERRYDRVTSVASLEHICDLPMVLARSAQLLEAGGALRAAIPSEGGLLWRLGWTLTTGLEFRLRHGLDYGDLMRHEHVNTAREIETLVRALFAEVEIRSFGLGRQLSLYRFIAARKPRLEVAAAWEAMFAR
ncbi:class I SAM-dependent methyltransferase [Phenylobacterium hankyongense]|uniref:Class I SAM-dependent methyltransferase n=1 Tax=Phenylobacterium hankyongense TaxID=1813876 RepID=A0A328B0L0_9CAUL|nr:class I SAM-dependent methyltransferase [Phenylobacterium hankyongense]RAK59981.1 class I SAM-dependent methyltransferase [Phenylobacterium hankyongense]